MGQLFSKGRDSNNVLNRQVGCTLDNGQLIIPMGFKVQPSQFKGRQDITSVIVGQAATIGECAFQRCTGLTSLVIPQGATIGNGAFGFCHSLTSLVIHQGVTIGKGAFMNCYHLTSLVIPQGVTIGDGAFGFCHSLTSLVIHQGVTIGKGAFMNCYHLTSLVIPQGVTIGDGAFRHSGLTSVVIPQDIRIGISAFYGCSRLTSLFIISPEDKEAAWIADAERISVRADKLKFIRPAFIEAIINRIILYLPSMGGRALEYPVYPVGLREILETNQGDLTPSPSTLQQLRFNNAAVVPHHQKEEIRHIAKAVLFVMKKAGDEYFLAPEMWFYILSFLFYQKLGPERFELLIDSLRGGFKKSCTRTGRAVLELKLDPMAGPDAGG